MGNAGMCRCGEGAGGGDNENQDMPSPDLSDNLDKSRGLAKSGSKESMSSEKERKAALSKEAAQKKKQEEKEAKAKAEKAAKEEAKRQAAEIEKRRLEEEQKLQQERLLRLGDLGKPGAKIQVELPTGWTDCTPDELKQVCDHIAGGGTKFTIQARGAMYFVDWTNPEEITQTNLKSKTKRKLRVVVPE